MPFKKKNNKKKIKKKKKKIPLAMRQNIWVKHFDESFKNKCYVSWCPRMITCFDFQVGHNIPESKGGKTDESNLFPICHDCNSGMGNTKSVTQSMPGNTYTIEEWSNKKFFND